MVARIVMTVPMRSRSFAIESSVRMVSFDVITVHALQSRKNAMGYGTVLTVRLCYK